jgi:transposase
VDRADSDSAVGEELRRCSEDLFTWWYCLSDGTLSRSTIKHYAAERRPWVRSQLKAGITGERQDGRGLLEVLAVELTLWTFVSVEGIESTNNAAERALRHAVLWRKMSHGTHGEVGSNYVWNILTVVATWRQQDSNMP